MTDLNDAVSIDFGHTRTKMAFYNPNTEQVELMKWGEGENFESYIPSIFVSEKNSGKIVVGEAAERILEHDLKLERNSRKWNLLLGFKMDLGKYHKRFFLNKDPSKTNPSELLMTQFLTELREKAGAHLVFAGRKPTTVYLTYTPQYDSDQVAILETSAKNAGFETVELVEEPLAAAQAFQAMGAKTTDDLVILDCGGWTLDFSYLHRSEEDSNSYDIETTDSKPIGGRDVDRELLDIVKKRSNANRQVDADAAFFLRQVRHCKEEYCRSPESSDGFRHQIAVPLGQSVVLRKDDIQRVIDRHVKDIDKAVKPHIESIKEKLKDKDGEGPVIYLIGGSSRLPGLKTHLEDSFKLTVLGPTPETEYAPVRGPLEILKYSTQKKEDKHDTPSTRKKKEDTLDNPTVTYQRYPDQILYPDERSEQDQKYHEKYCGMGIIDHPNTVSSVAISPDSKHLVTATDSTIYLWDLSETPTNHYPTISDYPTIVSDSEYAVTSVAFSSDSTFLAVAVENSIQLYELKTQRSAELTGHKDSITSIAFSPDSTRLASSSRDRTIQLWDVGKKENVHTHSGHKGQVNWVSWSSDGAYIASAGQDGIVMLHLPEVDGEGSLWRRHSSPVTWVGFIKIETHNILVSQDKTGTLKTWRTEDKEHRDFSYDLLRSDMLPIMTYRDRLIAVMNDGIYEFFIWDNHGLKQFLGTSTLYWKKWENFRRKTNWAKDISWTWNPVTEPRFQGCDFRFTGYREIESENRAKITSASISLEYCALATTNRTVIKKRLIF